MNPKYVGLQRPSQLIQSDSFSISMFDPTITLNSWAKSTPFYFLSIKLRAKFSNSDCIIKHTRKVQLDNLCTPFLPFSFIFIFSVSSFAIRNIFHVSSSTNSVSMSTLHFLGNNHGSYSSHLYVQTLLINNAPTFAHIPFYGELSFETLFSIV